MHHRLTARGVLGLLIGVLAAALLAACGSSSGSTGSARTLLQQTFSGSHPVTSGTLDVSLAVRPAGSSTLTGPVTLSLGGPFQSLGVGKLPKSNFTLSVSAPGRTTTVSLLSTGTSGYVKFGGASYQLPQATFEKLESSFSGLASSSGSGSGSNPLSALGIHPLDWLQNPSIVGNEDVGGTQTTHIRATINVAGLLVDLNRFLAKASSASKQLPSGISASTQQTIAREVHSPTFDLWTGTSDKTIRKLAINLTLPVTGHVQQLLGGMRSAQIALTLQYGELGQPQTITAPTSVRPFSQFQSQASSLLSALGATSGGTSSASGASSTTGSSSSTQKWSQCITAAHNDVTKMQACASLLSGG